MRGRTGKLLLLGAAITASITLPVALSTGSPASGPSSAAVWPGEATSTTVGPTVPPTTQPAPPPSTEPPPPPTTQPAPPPPTTEAPRPALATSWPTSLQPCGGDLPPCEVKWRESHGDYNAVSPDGLYRGAWQFAYGTWGGYGGYALANEAPPDVQDARAREVWAGGAGCGHWAAC